MKHVFNKTVTDKNYSELRKDDRYKSSRGWIANLIAHEWNLIKLNERYLLSDSNNVYDPLLDTGRGSMYKHCRIGTHQEIFGSNNHA